MTFLISLAFIGSLTPFGIMFTFFIISLNSLFCSGVFDLYCKCRIFLNRDSADFSESFSFSSWVNLSEFKINSSLILSDSAKS